MFCRKFLLAAAMLGALPLLCVPAHAAYTINVAQQGSNVVATGSGSIDTTALTGPGGAGWSGELGGSEGFAFVGDDAAQVWYGFSGPLSFGSGDGVFADSNTGDLTGIFAMADALYVPVDYVSGDALAGSAVWEDTTIGALGLTPGTYTWTWGEDASADSFTLNIGGSMAAPEPTSLALLLVPAALLPLRRTRRGSRPAI